MMEWETIRGIVVGITKLKGLEVDFINTLFDITP